MKKIKRCNPGKDQIKIICNQPEKFAHRRHWKEKLMFKMKILIVAVKYIATDRY